MPIQQLARALSAKAPIVNAASNWHALGIAERVTFTGWIPQEQLHEAYAHARCAVIPSLWPEPIATVGLELLHHGLPVVGFDAGGIGDWLRHEELGLLVPWNDTRNMAAAIDSPDQ